MAETIISRGFLIDLFYLFILFPDCIYALYDKTDKMAKFKKAHKQGIFNVRRKLQTYDKSDKTL